MTTQELRELDAWIAEHVMGWQIGDEHFIDPKGNYIDCEFLTEEAVESVIPRYSCCQYDAMDVLKKCAEKCGVRICEYRNRTPNVWDIYATDGRTAGSQAETLELAICLFAKQLFSQTTTK